MDLEKRLEIQGNETIRQLQILVGYGCGSNTEK